MVDDHRQGARDQVARVGRVQGGGDRRDRLQLEGGVHVGRAQNVVDEPDQVQLTVAAVLEHEPQVAHLSLERPQRRLVHRPDADERHRPRVDDLGRHVDDTRQRGTYRLRVDRDPRAERHPEPLAQGARGDPRAGLVDDLDERLETGARQLAGQSHGHDDGREARLIVVDVEPHRSGAAFGPGTVHEDGDIARRRRRCERRARGYRRHDPVPRSGGGQQDDHAQRDENAEQQHGPRVEAPQHRAQAAHFTRVNDVASAIMASLPSSLSSVLATQ